MKVLVIGAGLVGSAVAETLIARGDDVTVTATSEEKVATLTERFGSAVVLRGSDSEAVASATAGVDAVVVTAGPSAQTSMTPEGRAATYHDVLVRTAENVVAATGEGTQLIALSSLSVYGDAANHLDQIDEASPVTDSADPSPSNFLEMERTYREGAGDRAVIFRCGDIFGAGDPPIEQKVAMAHQYLGGSVPFSADALLYRLNVADAADAIVHALTQGLSGTYNLTHREVGPRNAELFDRISADQGLPALTYRNEIAAPSVPISIAALEATGFHPTRSF